MFHELNSLVDKSFLLRIISYFYVDLIPIVYLGDSVVFIQGSINLNQFLNRFLLHSLLKILKLYLLLIYAVIFLKQIVVVFFRIFLAQIIWACELSAIILLKEAIIISNKILLKHRMITEHMIVLTNCF